MTTEQINKLAQEIRVTTRNESVLDGLIHDAASTLASDANNAGLEGQIRFLSEQCGWSDEEIENRIAFELENEG